MELNDAQKAMLAQTKVEKLELLQSLGSLKVTIDQLFNDAPIAVAQSASKEELEELINEI